jgi:hypothetical protein
MDTDLGRGHPQMTQTQANRPPLDPLISLSLDLSACVLDHLTTLPPQKTKMARTMCEERRARRIHGFRRSPAGTPVPLNPGNLTPDNRQGRQERQDPKRTIRPGKDIHRFPARTTVLSDSGLRGQPLDPRTPASDHLTTLPPQMAQTTRAVGQGPLGPGRMTRPIDR